ncbi:MULTISPECIES: helix-turn-helix transcriptional regulator [unclassified Agrococcus]|uniref:helix-turn-helix transcriptional regulator n=1 Tax=unclassified Agrococcus TaxID=2615065 RepID=UPI0036191AE9
MAKAKGPRQSIALLVALIPYLTAERSVTVEEAAAHFEVPEQRIRDAVDLIFMSGVPDGLGDFERFDVNYDAYEQHGVIELSHRPALDGDVIRLAPREMGAILAGLRLIQGVQGVDDAAVAALVRRLARAAVPAAATIGVDAPVADQTARAVRDAIEHRVVVHLDYRKPGAPTERRTVAPTALELRDGQAYVRGFDLDRGAERRFRVDRTESVAHADVPFPDAALAPARERIDPDETIVVRATPAAAAMLSDYADGPSRPDGEHEIVDIRVWNADAVLRQVASLGGDAVVLRPASARAAMRRFAEDALRAGEGDGAA